MTVIFYGVFLCTILASGTVAQDNPVKSLVGVSVGIVELSRNIQCLADKHDSAEIYAKVYHAFDATVAGVKKEIDGLLTPEKFGALLQVFVVETLNSMKSIDSQCKAYCPQDNVDLSHAPKEIGDLGVALEKVGLTMSCLLDDPNPEVLLQFPVIVGTALQSIANSEDSSKTSAGILLNEVGPIAKGFQKLSSRCANIKRDC